MTRLAGPGKKLLLRASSAPRIITSVIREPSTYALFGGLGDPLPCPLVPKPQEKE